MLTRSVAGQSVQFESTCSGKCWTQNTKWLLTAWFCTFILALCYSSWKTSPTIDEPGHLVSGLMLILNGDQQAYRVNPPLPRAIAALPTLAFSPKVPTPRLLALGVGQRSEFVYGKEFLDMNRRSIRELFFVARLFTILTSAFGGVLLAVVTSKLIGAQYAWLALAYWSLSPSILTHSILLTPDIPATVAGIWMAYSFSIVVTSPPSMAIRMHFGGSLAIASLCKFTWLPIATALLLIVISIDLIPILKSIFDQMNVPVLKRFSGTTQDSSFRSLITKSTGWTQLQGQMAKLTILLPVLSYICVIGMGYDFKGMFRTLNELSFTSKTFEAIQQSSLIQRCCIDRVPIPLPQELLMGIDQQRCDFEEGLGPSYLFGNWSDSGWYSYYLISYFVKETPWFLMAALVGAWFALKKRLTLHERCYLLPFVLGFLLVSSQNGFSHHPRYSLISMPAVLHFASRWPPFTLGTKCILVATLFACLVSVAQVFPRSYCYFSELVGGYENGWKVLSHSGLDWGQDAYSLYDWLGQHTRISEVTVAFNDGTLAPLDGIQFKEPRFVYHDGVHATPAEFGVWVVSAYMLTKPEYAWFQQREPDICVSPTIRVYQVDPDDLN